MYYLNVSLPYPSEPVHTIHALAHLGYAIIKDQKFKHLY